MDALRLFLGYHYCATARVLDASRAVGDLLHRPLECSHGSLFGTLAHIVGMDYLWGQRCREGVSPEHVPGEADYADLDALRNALLQQEEATTAFLLVISPPDLLRTVTYRTTSGKPHTDTLASLLLHMANHGTYHRAEFVTLMRLLGHPMPDFDLVHYLRGELV